MPIINYLYKWTRLQRLLLLTLWACFVKAQTGENLLPLSAMIVESKDDFNITGWIPFDAPPKPQGVPLSRLFMLGGDWPRRDVQRRYQIQVDNSAFGPLKAAPQSLYKLLAPISSIASQSARHWNETWAYERECVCRRTESWILPDLNPTDYYFQKIKYQRNGRLGVIHLWRYVETRVLHPLPLETLQRLTVYKAMIINLLEQYVTVEADCRYQFGRHGGWDVGPNRFSHCVTHRERRSRVICIECHFVGEQPVENFLPLDFVIQEVDPGIIGNPPDRRRTFSNNQWPDRAPLPKISENLVWLQARNETYTEHWHVMFDGRETDTAFFRTMAKSQPSGMTVYDPYPVLLRNSSQCELKGNKQVCLTAVGDLKTALIFNRVLYDPFEGRAVFADPRHGAMQIAAPKNQTRTGVLLATLDNQTSCLISKGRERFAFILSPSRETPNEYGQGGIKNWLSRLGVQYTEEIRKHLSQLKVRIRGGVETRERPVSRGQLEELSMRYNLTLGPTSVEQAKLMNTMLLN